MGLDCCREDGEWGGKRVFLRGIWDQLGTTLDMVPIIRVNY